MAVEGGTIIYGESRKSIRLYSSEIRTVHDQEPKPRRLQTIDRTIQRFGLNESGRNISGNVEKSQSVALLSTQPNQPNTVDILQTCAWDGHPEDRESRSGEQLHRDLMRWWWRDTKWVNGCCSDLLDVMSPKPTADMKSWHRRMGSVNSGLLGGADQGNSKPPASLFPALGPSLTELARPKTQPTGGTSSLAQLRDRMVKTDAGGQPTSNTGTGLGQSMVLSPALTQTKFDLGSGTGPSLSSLAQSSLGQTRRPLASLAAGGGKTGLAGFTSRFPVAASTTVTPPVTALSLSSAVMPHLASPPTTGSSNTVSTGRMTSLGFLEKTKDASTGLSNVAGASAIDATQTLKLGSGIALGADRDSRNLQDCSLAPVNKAGFDTNFKSALPKLIRDDNRARQSATGVDPVSECSAEVKPSILNSPISTTGSPSLSINPVQAPPSSVAVFLFEDIHDPDTDTLQLPSSRSLSNDEPFISSFFPAWLGGTQQHQGFAFDQPSPDDVVSKAQKEAFKEKKAVSASSAQRTFSKPSSSIVASATSPSSKTNSSTLRSPNYVEDDDNFVEVLDDDDTEQMNFDIAGLNLTNTSASGKASAVAQGKQPAVSRPFSAMSSAVNSSQPTPPGSPKLAAARSPGTPKTLTGKKINIEEEYRKRNADKEGLNLVVIGHVDAGKSTLMGHLLFDLGEVNERTMKKYERDSQKIGKSSFAFAWVLDETGEERSRGITMDIAMNKFETTHRKFTLLDAPGHRDFIPKMISGASQADVAVMVVDSTTGEFEAGFEANGQTKEHALLVRSLGVQQLVVAINKLDVMDWSQSRYDDIVGKLSTFLTQAGFRKKNLTFIPVSGLTGENVVKRTHGGVLERWYTGPTLVEQIDLFEPPTRMLDKPFRLGVTDFFKGGIGSTGGISVAGRVDAGHIQVGDQVMVVPGGEFGTVKALEVNDESAKWAVAGDSVLVSLTGLDIVQLSTGSVLCASSYPVPVTSEFIARIVVFDVKVPITSGFSIDLHHQSLNEPAVITKLLAVIDKSTGEIVKKNPRHLSKSSTATVQIKIINRPIPLETFKENKELGRVMLRKGGDTVAAGVVVEGPTIQHRLFGWKFVLKACIICGRT
ncbi:hypothetical protein BC936DRAFT_136873 [Jimgerdemannia flammicorona]|uniref:Elongation factor 1 alpha-like protein n=1 Tax=Jimgerdemannia flammicorona TaxID=994334 RepID=A0A433DJB1_9FUNG|nr:hypothetical protein BC936DRAFT_136873 [Jimgerdemannia flammicorona]